MNVSFKLKDTAIFCRTRESDDQTTTSAALFLFCRRNLCFFSPTPVLFPAAILLLSIFSTTLLGEILCSCGVFLHADNTDVRRCWFRFCGQWGSSYIALCVQLYTDRHLRWHLLRRSQAKRRWGGVRDGEGRKCVFMTHLFTVPVSRVPVLSPLSIPLLISLSPLCPLSRSPLSPLFALLATNLDEVYSRYGQTQAGPALFTVPHLIDVLISIAHTPSDALG